MNNTLLLTSGGFFMILLVGSAMMMMRQSRLHERYAQRVKLAHGLVAPSTFQAKAEREAIQVATLRAIASLGQVILRSGVLSASTRTELQHTLAASGLHGANGLAAISAASSC